MSCKTLRLPLAAIAPDDFTFRITTRPCTDDLVAAIDALGLLHPPMVTPSGDRYRIVSGFRRVEACRRLRWRDMDARVLDSSNGSSFPARVAIVDNTFQRELNIIEQSRALNLLAACIEEYEDPGKTAEALGLPGHERMMRKLRKLVHMPARVQQLLLDGALSLAMIDEFERLDEEDASALTLLFEILMPSLMKQRELFDLIREIALRDRMPMTAVIRSPDILAVLNDMDRDRGEKSRRIRDMLKRRRFPFVSAAEDNLERAWKAMNPGNQASLKPPPYFEADVFSLTLRFRGVDDLRRHQGLLDRMASDPELVVFFKQQNRTPS